MKYNRSIVTEIPDNKQTREEHLPLALLDEPSLDCLIVIFYAM